MNLQLKERILQREKYSIGQSTGRKSDCLSQVTVSRDIGRKKVERTDRGKEETKERLMKERLVSTDT